MVGRIGGYKLNSRRPLIGNRSPKRELEEMVNRNRSRWPLTIGLIAFTAAMCFLSIRSWIDGDIRQDITDFSIELDNLTERIETLAERINTDSNDQAAVNDLVDAKGDLELLSIELEELRHQSGHLPESRCINNAFHSGFGL